MNQHTITEDYLYFDDHSPLSNRYKKAFRFRGLTFEDAQSAFTFWMTMIQEGEVHTGSPYSAISMPYKKMTDTLFYRNHELWKEILIHKFSDSEMLEVLQEIKGKQPIYCDPNDVYMGIGMSREDKHIHERNLHGQNKLGQLLQEVGKALGENELQESASIDYGVRMEGGTYLAGFTPVVETQSIRPYTSDIKHATTFKNREVAEYISHLIGNSTVVPLPR